jgi:hypothetical protein
MNGLNDISSLSDSLSDSPVLIVSGFADSISSSCNKGVYTMAATRPSNKNRRWFLLLLIIPFIAMLWPPFYNHTDPTLFDIPFFYWFQLLWVIITAIITAVVYFLGA